MIDIIAGVLLFAVLSLIWFVVKIVSDKPTHEEKIEKVKQQTATEQLQHANALLVEIQIIDALLPMLPKEFKDKLTKYLGGKQ